MSKCNDADTEYILSLSYGKDSIACLEACKQLGYRIDRVVHAEVWATDDIPADLPPMVEFKKRADKIIKERYGLTVEHVCAMRGANNAVPLNAHMTTRSIQKSKPQKDLVIDKTTWQENAIIAQANLTSTDSHVSDILGATQISKLICSQRLQKVTYQDLFYKTIAKSTKNKGRIYGFPFPNAPWCNGRLKLSALNFHHLPERRWCSI